MSLSSTGDRNRVTKTGDVIRLPVRTLLRSLGHLDSVGLEFAVRQGRNWGYGGSGPHGWPTVRLSQRRGEPLGVESSPTTPVLSTKGSNSNSKAQLVVWRNRPEEPTSNDPRAAVQFDRSRMIVVGAQGQSA